VAPPTATAGKDTLDQAQFRSRHPSARVNTAAAPSQPTADLEAASSEIVLADESEVIVTAAFTETSSFNTLRITAPIDTTLMSGNPITGSWRVGPFPAGTSVALDLLSGIQGNAPALQRLNGGSPCWLVEFEDYDDNDFNDLVVVVNSVAPGTADPYTGPAASTVLAPHQLAAVTREDGTRVTAEPARFVVSFSAVTACAEQPVDGWVDVYTAADPQNIGTFLADYRVNGRGQVVWDVPVGTPLTTEDQLCFFATYLAPSGFGTGYFFTYLHDCGQVQEAVTLKIDSVYGPNANGSFTTGPGEQLITLKATIAPAALAASVDWSVTPAPEAAAETQAPATIPLGATSGFPVPPPANAPGRWQGYGHPGDLKVKRLGYEATATVSSGGTTHGSEPARVYQDEIDVAREEYVEFGIGVPGRGEFTVEPPLETGINTGDYGVMVFNNAFVTHLNNLAFGWTAYGQWQVNSVYRNPIHELSHIKDKYGNVIRGSLNSWHLYACASDIQTFGADSAARDDFWAQLRDLATRQGFDEVEPKVLSTISHVHVEFHFCQ